MNIDETLSLSFLPPPSKWKFSVILVLSIKTRGVFAVLFSKRCFGFTVVFIYFFFVSNL